MTSRIVVTSKGPMKGKAMRTKKNKRYFTFKKIPYAQPPERFDLPEPLPQWKGIKDCSKGECNMCMQIDVMSEDNKFKIVGEEDCLYLNVFTTELKTEKNEAKLPVLVFLHGGAFCVGSNDSTIYGPEMLLEQSNMVLVTVNYRLGPLGFLCFGCKEAAGNQGLYDQVLALKWVRDEIKLFCGDSKNVTLWGQSAGAMAAFCHLVSPLSQGLFHKIIAMSGSPSTPFMHMDRDPKVYAKEFTRQMEQDHTLYSEVIVENLQDLPAKEVVEAGPLFKNWDIFVPNPWKPVVETIDRREVFMPKSYETLVKQGNFNKDIPIICGTTTEEGLILSASCHKNQAKYDFLMDEWETCGPQLLLNRDQDLITDQDREFAESVRAYYFGNRDTKYNSENLATLGRMFSTAYFDAPMMRDMQFLIENGMKNIYLYSFGYRGTMSVVDLFRLDKPRLLTNFLGRHFGMKLFRKKLGVCHGDDLFYVFPFSKKMFPPTLVKETDFQTSENMIRLFTNFATCGDPTPPPEPDSSKKDSSTSETVTIAGASGPLVWTRYNHLGEDSEKSLMLIGPTLEMGKRDPAIQDYIDNFNESYKEIHNPERVLSKAPIGCLFAFIAGNRPD